MARYAEKEDCLVKSVEEKQKVCLGCFYTHNHENYNWVVGFATPDTDKMVYVPEGTKLIGPNGVEYEVRLTKDGRWQGSLAHLHGREERFGMTSEVVINLQDAIELRFDEKRSEMVFEVKEIGVERKAVPRKRSLLDILRRKTA